MIVDSFAFFVAVAQHQNLSRAAAALHITQPAVTKQLKLLEENYGIKLHRRRRGGIELTQGGRIFFESAKRITQDHSRLIARLAAVKAHLPPASLVVGGSYSPSASFLPSLLARFEKSHPDVQLNLRTDDRLAVERMVLKGEVELALINNPPLNRHLTMEFFRLEPVVAFVTPRHSLARKKRLEWKDFQGVGFIVRKDQQGRGTVRDYMRYLRGQGFRPKVTMSFDTPAAIKEAVAGKTGVGILYRDSVAGDVKRGTFRLIKMPGNTYMGKSFIIYHKTRPLSPLAQEFFELLRSQKNRS